MQSISAGCMVLSELMVMSNGASNNCKGNGDCSGDCVGGGTGHDFGNIVVILLDKSIGSSLVDFE